MTECALKKLRTNRLDGLLVEDGRFILDPEFFSCCSGLGIDFSYRKSSANRCVVAQRLKAVNELARQFQKYKRSDWNLESFLERSKNAAAETPAKNDWSQQLYYSNGSEQQESAWLQWFVWSWTFGAGIHVISLRESTAEWGKHILKTQKYQQNLFAVLEVDRLWDVDQTQFLSAVVDYCEQSSCKIWLDVVATKKTPSSKSGQRKTAFSTKLNELRSRSALDHLDARTLSKLSVMHGFDRFSKEMLNDRNRSAKEPTPYEEIY